MKKLPKFGFNLYRNGVYQFIVQQADETQAIKEIAQYIKANNLDPDEFSYLQFNVENETVYKRKMFREITGYLVPIAVIDQSMNALFIYEIDSDWNSEQVEKFITSQGRHLSNCSWGIFDGEIIDDRG